MLSEREVISTLNMLRTEHLDVRTVTLGVSLFDCVSHDIELFIAKVKDKILRHAAQLVRVCADVGDPLTTAPRKRAWTFSAAFPPLWKRASPTATARSSRRCPKP